MLCIRNTAHGSYIRIDQYSTISTAISCTREFFFPNSVRQLKCVAIWVRMKPTLACYTNYYMLSCEIDCHRRYRTNMPEKRGLGSGAFGFNWFCFRGLRGGFKSARVDGRQHAEYAARRIRLFKILTCGISKFRIVKIVAFASVLVLVKVDIIAWVVIYL